jgi:hypothetical protein
MAMTKGEGRLLGKLLQFAAIDMQLQSFRTLPEGQQAGFGGTMGHEGMRLPSGEIRSLHRVCVNLRRD